MKQILIKENDAGQRLDRLLGRYLKDRERICGQILENLDKNGRNTEIISARIREMKQELDIVREGLAYYETVK